MRLSRTILWTTIKSLASLWCACCVGAFFSGLFVIMLGAPTGLQLPWSDLGDFVGGPEGQVYLHLRFYGRVLAYERSGKFVGSFASSAKGKLAIDTTGRLYFFVYPGNKLLVLDRQDGHTVQTFAGGQGVWVLGDDGQPRNESSVQPREQPGPVAPGQRLFPEERARNYFRWPDGTVLRRSGMAELERASADGTVEQRYASPWYLAWLAFPWPAAMAWPVVIGYAFISDRLKKKRRSPRQLALEGARRLRSKV